MVTTSASARPLDPGSIPFAPTGEGGLGITVRSALHRLHAVTRRHTSARTADYDDWSVHISIASLPSGWTDILRTNLR